MTIREIAEMAGVSSAMVSRYLNGGYVSAEKRAHIKEIIERTGYQPSLRARGLRTGSANLVGVLVPKINTETVSRIVAGVAQRLRSRGYQMLLATTDNDPKVELEYLRLFESYPVDGIVVVGINLTDDHRCFFSSSHVPVVVCGQEVEECASVYHDDFGAARALGHKLARSHPGSTFAYVGTPVEVLPVAPLRREGLLQGLADEGVAVDGAHVMEADLSIDAGYETSLALLDALGFPKDDRGLEGRMEGRDPLVIATVADAIAAGTLQACYERLGPVATVDGLVTVSGFGDSRVLRTAGGPIPGVHFPYKTSGARAAQLLLDQIDRRQADGHLSQDPAEPEAAPVRELLGWRLVGI